MRYEKSLKELIRDEAEGYTRQALSQAMKSASTSVDDLVRIGHLGVRDLSPQEIARIQEEVARMPFTTRTVKVPLVDRGKLIEGIQLERYTRSDLYHLFKHIDDGQWRIGTKLNEYLRDLQQAIGDSEHISTYIHQKERVVGFFARNRSDVSHLGSAAEGFLYVRFIRSTSML